MADGKQDEQVDPKEQDQALADKANQQEEQEESGDGSPWGWLGDAADIYEDLEGQATTGPIAATGEWLADDDQAEARAWLADILSGGYPQRSVTFPATRPPGNASITAENRQKWLDKAQKGKGLAPSAERLAAWYYLRHPDSAEDGWAEAGTWLPVTPFHASFRNLDGALWDLFTLAGFTDGVDTFLNSDGQAIQVDAGDAAASSGNAASRPRTGTAKGRSLVDLRPDTVGRRTGNTPQPVTPAKAGSGSTLMLLGIASVAIAAAVAGGSKK